MPTLVAINQVIAERADDFEDWLRTIVVPAVREHRPELEGRWEVLRNRSGGRHGDLHVHLPRR
jgi:hypothetical protein